MEDKNKNKKKIENSKKKVLEPAKKAEVKVSAKDSSGKKAKVLKNKKIDVKSAEVKTAKIDSKKASSKANSLKVTVVDVSGKSKGTMDLPFEIFGQKPNKNLIAQAVRVYLANQRQGTASTKTRSQVIGSTRKIYRQKGTGRARHGALKAPLFVGGGVAHGPHPHSFSLDFPKKMKKKALISALSQKAIESTIKIVDGDFSGKTKDMMGLLKTLEFVKKGNAQKVLFVVDGKDKITRGARNIGGLKVENVNSLTTYNIVVNKNLLFVKDAINMLSERFSK